MILTVLAGLMLVPAAQAGQVVDVGTLGSTPADAQFAEGSIESPDNTILVHLEKLVDGAAAGSNIIADVHQIAPGGRIDDALQRAQGRGVNVWVIYDGLDGGPGAGSGPFRWLVSGHFKRCPLGCLSSTDNPGTEHDSIMHIKAFLFSSSKRPGGTTSMPVVWVGSANLDANTGTNAYNDGITWYGDWELYNRTWDFMKDQWNGPYGVAFDYMTWPNDNPKTIGNGVFYSPASKTWGVVTPDIGDANGHLNIWAKQLSLLKAPNESGGSSPCYVRVMQNYLEDIEASNEGTPQVASELVRLARGGCEVRVLVNRTDTGFENIGPQTKSMLCSAPGDVAVRSVRKLHDKAVISRGARSSTTNTNTLWTGSHNMTRDALKLNDELIVRVEDEATLVDQYSNHFAFAWLGGQVIC